MAKVEPLPKMKFRAASTECEFVLVHLKRRENDTVGKSLARPIYTFAYTNRPGKPNFTTYSEEINRSVRTERWISIK